MTTYPGDIMPSIFSFAWILERVQKFKLICFGLLASFIYLEIYILHMGLFLSFIYNSLCFSLFAEVHMNPHVHVVYAAFCVYKINPLKTNLSIFNGSQPPINLNVI